MKLPTAYRDLTIPQKREVREQYIALQDNKCFYCGHSLFEEPPTEITEMEVNWRLFPQNFLQYPIHLQHSHVTGMTEGSVHAYCNAVMWQYEKR